MRGLTAKRFVEQEHKVIITLMACRHACEHPSAWHPGEADNSTANDQRSVLHMYELRSQPLGASPPRISVSLSQKSTSPSWVQYGTFLCETITQPWVNLYYTDIFVKILIDLLPWLKELDITTDNVWIFRKKNRYQLQYIFFETRI